MSYKTASKGKIKNAHALEANGLKFKSKLELYTYNSLLNYGITDFQYEEVKFELLEQFETTFDSYEVKKNKSYEPANKSIRSISYTPDFTRLDEKGKGWIIECKGYPNDAFPLKWKWFKQHLMENDFEVTLYKPNNQANVLKTIELIKEKYYA